MHVIITLMPKKMMVLVHMRKIVQVNVAEMPSLMIVVYVMEVMQIKIVLVSAVVQLS